ncbi:MAG: hypothetical protein JWL95_3225 [Gemmatimonadetes bacterium]|nr:hypothetical protein [Gemmatimonadota bacterium]
MNKRDGEGHEETGDTTETEVEDGGNVTPIRPKRRPRAVEESDPVPVPVSIFGGAPPSATHWACHRIEQSGAPVALSWGDEGESVELREWPMVELTEKTIRERWGAGSYKIQWLRSENGSRKSISYGRVFKLREVAPPPAPPPVVVGSNPMLDAFTLAMQITGMLEKQSDQKVSSVVQMAQMFAGRSNGLGAAELQLILQNQAQQSEKQIAAAVAAAVAPLNERLAAFDDDDDDDDEPSAVGAAARAVAPLIKGKGFIPQALNFASANPDLVKAVAPMAIGFAQGVLSLLQKQREAAQQQPAPPQPPRPRAVVEHEQPPQPPPAAASSPPTVDWAPHGPPPAEAGASS